MVYKITTFAVMLLFICLIPSLVFSLEISEIQGSIQDTNAQLTKLKADTTAQLTIINNKLDGFLTKDEMAKMLNAHLVITDQLLDSYKTGLTISWILTCLATLGCFYGIYFYFKSKRRI